MEEISWSHFEKVELRAGTIVAAEAFPEARKPAFKLKIDFGETIGIKNSSAQITDRYTLQELIGLQVVAVVNFPPKQIANFISECLVTGFTDDEGAVRLTTIAAKVPNGAKLL